MCGCLSLEAKLESQVVRWSWWWWAKFSTRVCFLLLSLAVWLSTSATVFQVPRGRQSFFISCIMFFPTLLFPSFFPSSASLSLSPLISIPPGVPESWHHAQSVLLTGDKRCVLTHTRLQTSSEMYLSIRYAYDIHSCIYLYSLTRKHLQMIWSVKHRQWEDKCIASLQANTSQLSSLFSTELND